MMPSILRAVWRVATCAWLAGALAAQQPLSPAPAPRQMPAIPDRPPTAYVIGAHDVILIQAVNAEQLNGRTFRVDVEGFLTLPLIGRIRASGLSIEKFETALTDGLREFIRDPQVIISLVERGARPIEVQQSVWLLGAFRNPGIYPLVGRDTVLDLLTRAGGLQPNAARRIRLTRRSDQGPIPLPDAVQESNASAVEITLNQNLELLRGNENVELKSHDILNVATLGMIYVAGEFARSGAFNLDDRGSLSVAQLISLAGLGPNAEPRKARVLRPVLDTSRRAEIPIDARAILEGRANDFPLLPNDVLVVPRSRGRATGFWRAVAVGATAAIGPLMYVMLRDRGTR